MRILLIVCLLLSFMVTPVLADAGRVIMNNKAPESFPLFRKKKKLEIHVFYTGNRDKKQSRKKSPYSSLKRYHLKTQWDSLMYGFSVESRMWAWHNEIDTSTAKARQYYREDRVIRSWALKTFYKGDISLPLRLCMFNGDARDCTWEPDLGDCMHHNYEQRFSYHNAALKKLIDYIAGDCTFWYTNGLSDWELIQIDFDKLIPWLMAHQTLSREQLADAYIRDIDLIKDKYQPRPAFR